jgi:hypothetical protein
MAKVTRSTAGAKFVSSKEKFNGAEFTEFNVNVKVSKGRAERLAMKARLAEAKAVMALPVTAGFVQVQSNTKFAYAV